MDLAPPSRPLNVVALGNAIVDVLALVDDAVVGRLGLPKGSMSLVDATESERVMAGLGPDALQVAGGSAANTLAGVASLGGSAAYVARVADDTLGRFFVEDLRATGVEFSPCDLVSEPGTGRCVVLVTPDGDRVMRTYLGASTTLGPAHVDADLIARASVLYLEGYLWDVPGARDAVRRAIALARRPPGGGPGAVVALSLSDPYCVERHREDFSGLVGQVDLLFGNEAEVTMLWGVRTLDEAVASARCTGVVGAFTRGPAGAVVAGATETIAVPAWPVDPVVDTTGAGDLFAAGFLYGLTHGASLEACARLGGLAAAEVVGHLGARPLVPLRELAEEASLVG
jgi:sugar/nucleoside kinase (ribokinase family)